MKLLFVEKAQGEAIMNLKRNSRFNTAKLIILFGLSFSGHLLAQAPISKEVTKGTSQGEVEATTNDGKKVLLRSDGTWVFVTATSSQTKSIKNLNGVPVLATPENVALFPKDYLEKTVRFGSVKIGDIGSYNDGSQTAYPLEVESPNGKSFYNSVNARQGINFLMDENIARILQSKYQSFGKGYLTQFIVNLVVIIKAVNDGQGNSIVFGVVRCIEFQNTRGSVTETIGCN